MAISKCKRLKDLIHAPRILVLPGVFDGFSTRLVSRAGYTAAFITGSGVSESRLGQSDVGIMGLDENVAAARAIALHVRRHFPASGQRQTGSRRR